MASLLAPVLLAVTLALFAWFQRKDRRGYARFRAIEDSARRQRVFLRWAARGCALYLGLPLTGLFLLGRIDALWTFPPEFAPLAPYAPALPIEDGFFVGAAIGAVVGGMLFGAWLGVRRRRRGAAAPHAPDIAPLQPRNRAEIIHILPLLLNAGVSEELCFRLYLPLLLSLCGLPAWAAFALAILIFGLLHRYQGLPGIAITGAVGAILSVFYLATLSLALPIAAHLVINLNSLVLRPAIYMREAKRGD